MTLKTYSTLIVTVGSSLLGNLKRNEKLKTLLEKNELQAIGEQMVTAQWGDPESERLYGSEINSTASLIRNFEQIENAKLIQGTLCLFISDTPQGNTVGALLKHFFEQNEEFRFGTVQLIQLKGLTHSDEHRFGTEGLRNVVREFARIARTHANNVIVNSTGGYKAQIAFALALGQALKFPVYYRFEAFSKIIKMPPLPVSLDWEIYLNHFDILETLESADLMEEENLKQYGYNNFASLPKDIKAFIDREKIDKTHYLEFNPMGQVFLESARELIRLETKLSECATPPKEKFIINSKEGHAIEFDNKHKISKTIASLKFVEKVHLYDFHAREKDELKVKLSEDNIIRVLYGDKKGTAYYEVQTTGKGKRELIAAVEEIKKVLQ